MVKKVFAIILAITMVLSMFVFSVSAQSNTKLRFNSDGKFKIVVFADTQDGIYPDQKLIDFMCLALDNEKPDLVVFDGDNIVVGLKTSFRPGVSRLLTPLVDRNIPYAYTFGNHDAEDVSKDYMHGVYESIGDCLTYDADPSITGFGNCNIPIYSSNGSNAIAFNLWMIDSNMYDSNDEYDHVHQDQLDWFVRTDMALEQSQGHKINSLVFQHMALPEIYNCLVEDPNGSGSYGGKKYSLTLNSTATGHLGEFPCPGYTNGGEFAALKSRGNVLGVVTGHDHKNSFVGTYQDMDFIQIPGMTFKSYNDDNVRGYGVIELDENNTSTYSSHVVRHIDRDYLPAEFSNNINNDYYRYTPGTTFISDIAVRANSDGNVAKNELMSNGYSVIDFDLNKGAGGDYIYMGYKTTTNYADAIKNIRFHSSSSSGFKDILNLKFNGQSTTYYGCPVDLNQGATGNYIYCYYSKDGITGPAITSINFATSTSGAAGKVCGLLAQPNSAAELNKGTRKHNGSVYCFTSSANVMTVDPSAMFAAYNELSAYKNPDGFSATSTQNFNNKFSELENDVNFLNSMRAMSMNSTELTGFVNDTRKSCAELSDYDVHDGFIYGFARPMTTAEFAAGFSDYSEASVTPTGKFVGTGSTVNLSYGGYNSSYKTVTFGDVNGDGWYDGQDCIIVSCIANGMLTREQVGEAQYFAADCNHDDVVDNLDVAILNEAGVLLSTVDQLRSSDELIQTSSAYVEYLSLIDQNPTLLNEEIETEPQPESQIEPEKQPEDTTNNEQISFLSKLVDFVQGVFSFIKPSVYALNLR